LVDEIIMENKFHDKCFGCGENSSPKGLKLKYSFQDNKIVGSFKIPPDYQGYDDIVHGGIITTILDCSMVNLFLKRDGISVKTAKLNVRFKRSLPVNRNFVVTAVADDKARHFYKARAWIKMDDKILAEAEGYFRK
jgi:acyl-coenzyme A thioesterase PaaI-like protein